MHGNDQVSLITPKDSPIVAEAKTPDVSFVVIGYNEAEHIKECLESIFAQGGLTTFEVIFVDDASTDRTSEIVADLQHEHKQLRLIRHEENRGRGAARRTGQDACRGSMIAFIDADIRVPGNWLTKVVAGLDHADAISGVAVPDGDCAVIWRMFGPRPRGMLSYWDITGNNVIFKRAALERVGWPASRPRSEDNRMARAMVEAGMTVTTIRDLQVEHHESKSYWNAWRYMWGKGYHANEILRDLRVFRFPDLVWVAWFVALLGSIALAVVGVVPGWEAVALIGVVTVAIDLGAMVQRFYFAPAPLRWLAAAAANLPLIVLYLAARSVSSPRLLLQRQWTDH